MFTVLVPLKPAVCIFSTHFLKLFYFILHVNEILENVHKSLDNQTQNWIQISQLEKLLEITPVLVSKTSSFNINHANRINSKNPNSILVLI